MDKCVSVIIPTYNRRLLTDRAVESVKARRPELVEILVVDDCGTEPYNYAAQLNHSGISVRVIRLAVNGGAGRARGAGVNEATGELIAFLDSDDEFGGAWLDALIQRHLSQDGYVKGAAIYVGRAQGGSFIAGLVWSFVKGMPAGLRLWAGRVITVFFNPFYTPSIAISRHICRFSDKLRYCEDYYTMVGAIFRSRRLEVIDESACVLGRAPNSTGGMSGARTEMFKGEMSVRMEMLKADYVPLCYKALVPPGMAYQIARSLLKSVFMRQRLMRRR